MTFNKKKNSVSYLFWDFEAKENNNNNIKALSFNC